MVLWIGGTAISKTRYWVKEFLVEGEPALRTYIQGMRAQYRETLAVAPCDQRTYDLKELAACGKYAARAYEKAYGRGCP